MQCNLTPCYYTFVFAKEFIIIRFGSLKRDYLLSNGDTALEKGLRSQHGKEIICSSKEIRLLKKVLDHNMAKMFSCTIHLNRYGLVQFPAARTDVQGNCHKTVLRPREFFANKFSINAQTAVLDSWTKTVLTHWLLHRIPRDPLLIPWRFLEIFQCERNQKINYMCSNHRHKILFRDIVY